MPSFTNPAAFLFLLLIPLLFILRKLKIFNRISFPSVLTDWEGTRFVWKGKSHKLLTILAKIMLGIGFILVIIAFADPVKSFREKVYTTLGTDVIFVVDTSPSMAAKDINGLMRLDVSKQAIYNISNENKGCQFGLVALGSNASVLVPPTSDFTTFNERLSKIQVGLLGTGSAIGDGLSTAVCHLVSSSAPKKCIILLTDGENNAGEIHPETAAKLATDNNITIYVVGIGSKGTVPLEYTDPITGKYYSGYLDSDFNVSSLKKIASIGKGHYYETTTIDELAITLKTIAKLESVSQKFTYKTVNKSYYHDFLLIAIILFSLSWIIKRIILRELVCFKYKKILYLRSAFLGFSFIMILLAYSGISWGTFLLPVQKNGNSVAMVFDISNSMNANDGAEGSTRLYSSSIYAKKLLSKMTGTSVSVVLAKGDGVAAIPLTYDVAIIESLLNVLSSRLSTSPGSNLAKGILKAKETFTSNFSSAGRIWLFTDGEETDGQLENAFLECLKSGIPVTVIGFGSEIESEILAGDNTTTVKTALRTDRILNAIKKASEKFTFYGNTSEITYINSNAKGSALYLLNQLNSAQNDNVITSYETKPISRYKLFLSLAILSFIFSYIFTEVNFIEIIHKSSTSSLCFFCFCSLFIPLNGCSSNTKSIIDGTFAYHKKQYKHSVSKFLSVTEQAIKENDETTLNYSLYDLGTAYLMLGEEDAAIERFLSLSSSAPKNVLYSAYYNAGFLCHKNGDYEEAKNYFRKALEVDNSRIEAKINFELSLKQAESQNTKQNESNAIHGSSSESENENLEKSIFERIKENDQNQWKNSELSQNQNLANDY